MNFSCETESPQPRRAAVLFPAGVAQFRLARRRAARIPDAVAVAESDIFLLIVG